MEGEFSFSLRPRVIYGFPTCPMSHDGGNIRLAKAGRVNSPELAPSL